MSERSADFLNSLQQQIAEYANQIKSLTDKRSAIDEELSKVQQCLQNAKALLDAEQRRLGKLVVARQPALPLDRQFAGMWARGACHVVLRENERMHKQEIVDALLTGGFDFGGKNPLRVVHFALIRDPHVKMYPNGICEWIESEA